MEKKMENEMETGMIMGYVRVILGFSSLHRRSQVHPRGDAPFFPGSGRTRSESRLSIYSKLLKGGFSRGLYRGLL